MIPRRRAKISTTLIEMSEPARPPATKADLDALPENIRGEIIDGTLYAMTRPRAKHQAILLRIAATFEAPFHLGKGGPGGWWILPEPGIDLPRSPEVVPDVAGWRRARMPELPDGSITLVPDWVCEVLSPTTRRHNLLVKVPYYARIGVPYLWLVDLDARALLVSKLEGGHWVDLQRFGDETAARILPFDDVETDVASWWAVLGAPSDR